MKITVTKINPNKLAKRLGVSPGGKVQEFHTNNVARRMMKYLPVRSEFRSVPNALKRGANLKTGEIKVKLPYAKYLFYGKVMAGKPKRPTGKNLRYTAFPNTLAGPFWDRRLKQNEMKQITSEANMYIRSKI